MSPSLVSGLLFRFWLGAAGGLVLGYLAFQQSIFRPDHPAFACVTVGMLTAGMLALVRLGLNAQALALALAYGAFLSSMSPATRWVSGAAGLLLGLGVFVVAVIFDELARIGFRFGKFLVVGPLLGGVFLAVAPLAEFHDLLLFDAVRPLLIQLLLGIIIGDGVGLGVELAELLPSTAAHESPLDRPVSAGAPAESEPRHAGKTETIG